MTAELLLVLAGAAAFFALGWFLCSRTQRNRMDAAVAVSGVSEGAAGKVLDAAARLADVGARVEALTTALEANSERLTRVVDAVDSNDRGIGSILNVLVNSGLIKSMGGREPEFQHGETPFRRVPPVTGDGDIPIPSELRPESGALR